jgi:hypothetical protein
MNLNLPSNLFYLKENFTENPCPSGQEANVNDVCVPIEVCERGKYRPKSGGGCIDAPMSGDRGYFVFADLVISLILLIHATARVFAWKIKSTGAWAYFGLSIVGFLMTVVEMIYFLSAESDEDTEEKEQEDREDKKNEDTATKLDEIEAGNDTNTTELFTVAAEDALGMETTKVLFGLRVTNYILLMLTIAAGAASSGVLMSDN